MRLAEFAKEFAATVSSRGTVDDVWDAFQQLTRCVVEDVPAPVDLVFYEAQVFQPPSVAEPTLDIQWRRDFAVEDRDGEYAGRKVMAVEVFGPTDGDPAIASLAPETLVGAIHEAGRHGKVSGLRAWVDQVNASPALQAARRIDRSKLTVAVRVVDA